jgi:hypothetical protein
MGKLLKFEGKYFNLLKAMGTVVEIGNGKINVGD